MLVIPSREDGEGPRNRILLVFNLRTCNTVTDMAVVPNWVMARLAGRPLAVCAARDDSRVPFLAKDRLTLCHFYPKLAPPTKSQRNQEI